MSSQPNKRKRHDITAHEKREICRYKLENPKASLDGMSNYFANSFGHGIGKSTIGDILKKNEKWLNIVEDESSLSRSRHAKNQKLEQALYLWLSDMSSRNGAINDQMLIEKAKRLGEQMNVTDFAYSRGWLSRFKSRHNVAKYVNEGEAASADKNAVVSGREELKKVLNDYAPEDVFNMDETGLFFKLGPNYTLASKPVKGVKRSKDRITVALCANSTGDIKIKPFVIAKARRPRCFGNDFNPEVYVRYRNNKKAWMTSDLFCDWIRAFDRQMKSRGREVILLVDNAASHACGNVALSNVKVHFLPPNTTVWMRELFEHSRHTTDRI
ncbi:CENP-B homolog protein 2-like [Gigantopelta aegis]|uniref:CENP-B homolog protein 2-like n=1 Tax=Gigantopelta aegis TaxID=1735272 RepID=UPI001B888215|nr:CENP-B homolog protein 2-like [Gigantopelta aegis]